MDINTRSRTELKAYFVKNAIPTESNFAELIDGMLNQQDDGLVKSKDNPLSIESAGESVGGQPVVNFYRNIKSPNPDWVLSLNPLTDPNNPGSGKLGLGVSDGQGNSRLFIDQNTGNVGLGTMAPTTPLAILGNGGTYVAGITQNQVGGGATMELTTTDVAGDQATRLLFRGHNDNADIEFYRGKRGAEQLSLVIEGATGNVGVGTTSPGEKLEVTGVVRAVDGLRIDGNRNTHLNKDGAIYRYGGQIYITVDDNLYIRDTDGTNQFHFDTNNGTIKSGSLTVGSWPPSPDNYVFFGTNSLNQGQAGNYALLQDTTGDGQGRTYLNSPVDIRFRINNDDKVILANNGNLGVGTASPGAKLQVVNTSQDADGNTLILGPANAANLRLGYHSNYSWIQSHGGKPLAINPIGNNVGVGTTNPQDKLDLHGTLRFNSNADMRIYGATRGARNSVVLDGHWDELEVKGRVIDWTGSNLHLGYDNDHSDDAIYMGNGKLGKVEIQTDLVVTGTINKLDVAENFSATVRAADFYLGYSGRRGNKPGRALVDGGKTLNINHGTDWSSGIKYYGSLQKASSRTLKENISEITSGLALAVLADLTPVQFNLKVDETKTPQLGFIAEEVPHWIAGPDREAIINDHIVAILTRIVKDQQKSIEVLQQKLSVNS